MPTPTPKKCRECAYLDLDRVMEQYGGKCYEDKCRSKRSRIRNAAAISQRRKRKPALELEQIDVAAPQVAYAVLQVWRERGDAPIHALGGTIWQGNDRIAEIAPVHCLGWKPQQVLDYAKQILVAIGDKYPIKYFSEEVILPPETCRIDSCYLKNRYYY